MTDNEEEGILYVEFLQKHVDLSAASWRIPHYWLERIALAEERVREEIAKEIESKEKETYQTNKNVVYDTEQVGFNHGLQVAANIARKGEK